MREDRPGVISASARTIGGVILGIALFLALASAAVAFTVLQGFAASTYASGYPIGGPSGIAFINGTMYTADASDHGLYTNTASGTPMRVGTVPGTPTGLASFGQALYAIDSASNGIVQLNPATGAVTATLATQAALENHTPSGIAADPVTGDLWIATSQGFVYAIPAASPRTPAFKFYLTGFPTLFGIAVASDHSLYVAAEGPGANGIRQVTSSLAQSPIGPDYLGARGVGVVSGYVLVNNVDGSITKIKIPDVGVGTSVTPLSGGATGGSAAIGTDGCFYASQGPAVIRLANANGTCDLTNAAPPPPPPSLTLIRTSSNTPLIGNGDQSFQATLANVASPGNIVITFTVANVAGSTTYARVTDATGSASFSYAATTVGTDTITARATINGSTTSSNTVSLNYPRALDTVKPVITYTITTGTPGANFACANPKLGQIGVKEYCGWYVTPPTVHFSVTKGPGGLTDPIYSCPDFTLTVTSPIDGTPTTCNATNADGLPAAFTVVLQATINPPTVSATATVPTGPYGYGQWTNQNVTVSFTCATDPVLGPAGITDCAVAQTVSTEGTSSVSGYAVDVAGTRVTKSFGPINIDKTAPVVTATMATADGNPYTANTPTVQDVIVSFTCTDNLDPAPTCPSATMRVSSGPSVTVTASDRAGNSKSYSFGGINIDRTGPTVGTAITPAPDPNGNNALSATVNITATDPSGIGSITYSANGAQTIAATTVAATGAPGAFTARVALNTVGTTVVTYSAKDSLGNTSATGTVTVKIISTQPTTLTITSTAVLAQGGVTVRAQLLGLGGAPAAGQTVSFTAAGVSASSTTDVDGVASATLALAPGTYTLQAAFAGSTGYLPSNVAAQTLTVYGLSQFSIWGGNAGGIATGQRVIFWGSHWSDSVDLPQNAKVNSFKGYADTVSGTSWTAKPGNSKPPQAIPTYISVIITSTIDKNGGTIRGNIIGHAVLRVDSPYANDPGTSVYGVVIANLP